eukprot:c16249_g1_i1.p1 GENE.c16249_g1_i1~~c16249_g1_i1.p1  ORF type:complete len:236 (-),score=50.87 c16249_g1_i1:18-692(-)
MTEEDSENFRVEPHNFSGLYVLRGKSHHLASRPASDEIAVSSEIASVHGEKYRILDAFACAISAAVISGLDQLGIAPGKRVLYLARNSWTSVTACSDIVGPNGRVFVVAPPSDFSPPAPNVKVVPSPVTEPHRYEGMDRVDVIFAELDSADQSSIVIANANQWLENSGTLLLVVNAKAIDPEQSSEQIFAGEVRVLKQKFQPREQLTMEPYRQNYAVIVFNFRG